MERRRRRVADRVKRLPTQTGEQDVVDIFKDDEQDMKNLTIIGMSQMYQKDLCPTGMPKNNRFEHLHN